MNLQERQERRISGRKPKGIAACLLPYKDQKISREDFASGVTRTNEAGLDCAVNMDTGYANHLTDDERREILALTRDTLGTGRSFVAGVFVEGREGDLRDLYRQGCDEVVEHGGTPILFQTTRFHDWKGEEIVKLYSDVCANYDEVIGFELGRMFAPNGMIFEDEVFRGLLGIPSLTGIKHSSLSRERELGRLALRDEVRPDFRIFTGNDLGIDMIEYGSDYLLGLAAFCPEKFAERDQLWAEGNADYVELNDALQYLGNVAFRAPVPAYKHSCASFQHLLGRISSNETHPDAATRPDWESEMMQDCARRLGYQIDV